MRMIRTWVCLVGLALWASSAPAGVILNPISSWPDSSVFETMSTDTGSDRGTGLGRNPFQTFQVDTTFTLDKVYIYYRALVADPASFTIRLFAVDDVNIDASEVPLNSEYVGTGTVLFTEEATPGTGYSTTEVNVMEFDLTGSSEVTLSASTGTTGYAFQIMDSGASHSFSWRITTAVQGSLYEGGRMYEWNGSAWNSFSPPRDFPLAITPTAPPAVPGDFDGDGDVDGADFVVWQTNFPTAEQATLADGDADGDGDVDGADFVVWQTNFPTSPGPGVVSIPEPSALTLTLCGLAGLAALVLRQKRCQERMALPLDL